MFARSWHAQQQEAWKEVHAIDVIPSMERDHWVTAEQRLTPIKARISNLVDQIEHEAQAPRSVLARLTALEAEEDEMTSALAALPVALSPALPNDHKAMNCQAVEELNRHLAAPDSTEVRGMLRSLISRVAIHDGDSCSGERRSMELHGDLHRLLGFEAALDEGAPETTTPRLCGAGRVVTGLVAGTGFDRCRTRVTLPISSRVQRNAKEQIAI